MVAGEAVDPGREKAVGTEVCQPGDDLDQDLLARVAGIIRMTEPPHGKLVDEPLNAVNQGVQRVAIAGTGAVDQSLHLHVVHHRCHLP